MSVLQFSAWILVIHLVVAGQGRAILRWINEADGSFLWSPWVGLALVFLELQLIHLFLPMDWIASAIVGGLGIIGWVLAPPRDRQEWWWVLSFLGLLLLWAVVAGWGACMGVLLQYDWGLYYQQAQLWASECPVVPGLGNLHSRLAFPNASFLLAGCFGSLTEAFWGGRLLASFVLSLSLGTWSALLLHGWMVRDGRAAGYAAMSFSLVALFARSIDQPAAAPDLLLAQMMLVFGYLAVDLLGKPRARSGELTLLAVALLQIKLSSIFLVPWVLAILAWKVRWRPGWKDGALGGVFLASWSLHNWIQSGWPLFPLGTAIGNPDWAMQVGRVEQTARAIRGWARLMGPNHLRALEGYPWLDWWWDHLRSSLEWSALIRLAPVAICVFVLGFLRRKEGIGNRQEFWLIPPVLFAWALWWVSAPDIRFARGYLWILLALLAGWGTARISRQHHKSFVLAALLSFSIPSLVDLSTRYVKPMNPRNDLRQVVLPSGLEVWTPVEGDQVWSAPIPATPEISDLIPRGPSLCDGFRDGGRPLAPLQP